jgi:hypothetical protein
VRDVSLALTAEETIACGKIPDQSEGIENRTLAGSVGATKHTERVKFRLEGDEASEVVRVEPSYHGVMLAALARTSILLVMVMRAVRY